MKGLGDILPELGPGFTLRVRRVSKGIFILEPVNQSLSKSFKIYVVIVIGQLLNLVVIVNTYTVSA